MVDLKRTDPLYFASALPRLAELDSMNYMVKFGKGGAAEVAYQDAIKIVYSTAYGIKMKGKNLSGYHEFVVPPLESLWWGSPEFIQNDTTTWRWSVMIRLPDFVDAEVLKKFSTECSFFTLPAQLGVQALHTGAYSDNSTRIKLQEFAAKEGLRPSKFGNGLFHEVYLSDPRRTEESKLKTIIRMPVEK